MDSNSTPSSQTKSASRLARIGYTVIEPEEQQRPTIPHLSLDPISPSPKKTTTTTPASPSPLSLPLQDLLLLSPAASPLRRSRTRLADRLEMAEEVAAEQGGHRRRCKSRAAQMGVSGCGSPRNSRRSRRRVEMEAREDREMAALGEEMVKPRKRRNSGKSKKEKLTLVPYLPSSSLSPKLLSF